VGVGVTASKELRRVCVIYLAWKPLGLEAFASFVTSYRAHRAGIAHDLLVIFKGFASDKERAPFSVILREIPHHSRQLPVSGLDITSYFDAARLVEHGQLCFLNSSSVILADDWLGKMVRHLSRPEVGVVGATGSYESTLSAMRQSIAGARYPRSIAGLRARQASRRRLADIEAHFDAFPNRHLRTNSFATARDTMLGLRFAGGQTKMDSLRFESGRQSMTRQILAQGLDVLVVGRDGYGYKPGEWYASRTFRSSDQENLLVADNRTRQYQEADAGTKVFLRKLAWGVE
jgi:hypothetical protein